MAGLGHRLAELPSHFESITKGVVDLPSIVFYLSLIAFALFVNKIVIDESKAA